MDYTFGKKLGEGGFGTVYLCHDNKTGREMAVKIIKLSKAEAETMGGELAEVKKEVETLKACQHERIVEYIGCENNANGFCIFLEYMPGGSLADQIKRNPFPESTTLKYTKQIFEGLAYLHSKNIIHRDIKGDNILCDNQGNIKLTDFGIARQMSAIITSSVHMTTGIGTVYWMAPEVLQSDKYDCKADIWSAGCTIVEMLTGAPPHAEYKDTAVIWEKIKKNPHPEYKLPPGCSEKTKKLLQQTFEKSPQNRPSAAKILGDFF